MAVKWTGCMDESSRANVQRLMRSKTSFGLMPGGFMEAASFEHGKDVVVIKRKKAQF